MTRSEKIKKTSLAAAFTAIIAVCAQICLPLPSGIPITLQTLSVALCGYVMGAWGTAPVGAYLLLGAVGIPIFSSFSGGLGILLGKTGGFLFGFLVLALFCGISAKFKKPTIKIIFSFVGVLLCHIVGTAYFSIITKGSFLLSATVISLPFILKDLLSVLGAYFLATAINKRILKP